MGDAAGGWGVSPQTPQKSNRVVSLESDSPCRTQFTLAPPGHAVTEYGSWQVTTNQSVNSNMYPSLDLEDALAERPRARHLRAALVRRPPVDVAKLVRGNVVADDEVVRHARVAQFALQSDAEVARGRDFAQVHLRLLDRPVLPGGLFYVAPDLIEEVITTAGSEDQALGPIGILVGPMVVAFLQTLLNILHQELTEMEEAATATVEPD